MWNPKYSISFSHYFKFRILFIFSLLVTWIIHILPCLYRQEILLNTENSLCILNTFATVSFFYSSGNPNISLADRRNVYLRVAPCRSYDRRGRPNHINRSGYPSNKDIRVPENDNFKQCTGYAGMKSIQDQRVCCLLFCIVFENIYPLVKRCTLFTRFTYLYFELDILAIWVW